MIKASEVLGGGGSTTYMHAESACVWAGAKGWPRGEIISHTPYMWRPYYKAGSVPVSCSFLEI